MDWLTFTFEAVGSVPDGLEQVRRYVKLWSDMPINLVPANKGLRGYTDSLDVVTFVHGAWEKIGIVAWGHGGRADGRIRVDLSGRGCAIVTDWPAVFATMQDLDARITRCDLALDFLEGELSIAQVEQMYLAGEFHCGGRIPEYRKIESGTADAKGCGGTTFEIGLRTSGKMLRAYEKGRQLRNRESQWVRTEIEFRNKDREIPHEIVLKRDEYFIGAYQALEPFVDVAALRCRTDQAERETTIETAKRWLKRQAGKSINQMLIENGEDYAALVADVRQPGTPPRMLKSALAVHVHGAHEPAPHQRE
ncbi:replication initiation factor domain-containing protein [Paraburkholderia megapolitana]|uniref:replication initiation factor domain-containing protein n=1 Tax=Paraburkholderia megapolitana TaxID=420953 RepID=UPI0038B78F59